MSCADVHEGGSGFTSDMRLGMKHFLKEQPRFGSICIESLASQKQPCSHQNPFPNSFPSTHRTIPFHFQHLPVPTKSELSRWKLLTPHALTPSGQSPITAA